MSTTNLETPLPESFPFKIELTIWRSILAFRMFYKIIPSAYHHSFTFWFERDSFISSNNILSRPTIQRRRATCKFRRIFFFDYHNATITLYNWIEAYNLSYHPKFSNGWRNFDFDAVDLNDLFENATYGKSEFFGQYGLDGEADSKLMIFFWFFLGISWKWLNDSDVQIVSGIYFNYGQCHTMKPKVTTRRSWKNHGYSLILTHTMEATDETKSENIPGWHLFLHEEKENFTGMNSVWHCGQ